MAYYIRRIITDAPPVLSTIAAGSSALDPNLRFQSEGAGTALVISGEVAIAELELNRREEDIFDDEINELLEELAEIDGDAVEAVSEVLQAATCIAAVRVLFGDRSASDVLADLTGILDWLGNNTSGLTQVDGEGYYAGQELILET